MLLIMTFDTLQYHFAKMNGSNDSRLPLLTHSPICLSVYLSGKVEKKNVIWAHQWTITQTMNGSKEKKLTIAQARYTPTEEWNIDPNHRTENLSTIFYLLCPTAWQFQFYLAMNAASLACKVPKVKALLCHIDYRNFLLLTPAAVLLI